MSRAVYRKYVFLTLTLLVILLALSTVYFYKKNTVEDGTKEIQTLIRRISEVAILPEGETPTIATVSDPEALKDQSFFTGAKKGDKVLIFTQAKKAYLYDPDAHKIINIAPMSTTTGEQDVFSPVKN